MSGRLRCALVYLLLPLAGCRLGRAVVGEREVESGGAELCSVGPPTCSNDPLPAPPLEAPPRAAAVDLIACGAPPPPLDCSAAGPIEGATGPCDAAPPIDDAQQGAQALAALSCGSVRIRDLGGEPVRGPLRVSAPQLENANVAIETVRPLSVELEAPLLSSVWFELRGPVTLRVLGNQLLDDLRISSAGAGGARVELLDVKADALSVNGPPPGDGQPPEPFAGELAVERSVLQHARVHALELELESSELIDGELQLDRLRAADSTLVRVRASARDSQLSTCRLGDADFSDCQSFSALETISRNTRLSACEDAARLYGGRFGPGSLEGPLVLDHLALSDARIGLHAATPIAAWDSNLMRVRFCRGAQSISFGGSSSVGCSQCDTSMGPCALAVCVLTDAELDAIGGSRTAVEFSMPPSCVPPEPARMRPSFH
jgi:hypothetical protein